MPELTCGQCPVTYTEDGVLCCPLDDDGDGDNKYRVAGEPCVFVLSDLMEQLSEYETAIHTLRCVVQARLARGERP